MKRLIVLMAAAFVDMIGYAIVFPLLPYYALRLQADEWMIGWMIASFSIAQLASSPWWGRMSDHIGRRTTILFGLGLSAAAFVVFGFAVNIWMLFLSRVIQGLGGGTTGVLQAYVADVTEPKDRVKALGWLSSATGAGVMIGPAIGSLAFKLGPEAPGIVAAALCFVNIIFAWRMLQESYPGRKRDTPLEDPVIARPVRSVREMITEVLRAPGGQVAQLIWIYAVGMLGFMSMTAVLALYLHSDFGITEETIFIFFVYVGAIGVFMRAVMLGKLVDWLGEVRLMRVGAALLALGLAAIPLPDSVVPLGLVIAIVPIGTACLFPATSALVTHRASKHEMGQTLSVQQAVGGMARVVAPIWATAAFQGLGVSVPFYISGAVVGLVTLLAFRVSQRVPVEAT
ncbi:MAG: MFS transporter [Gemmatimonadales bacterium]|nr:MFS transporter [Gemmatimonadales bacterium]NIN13354.1 MFS transporter [Gemmatimonadales bacterium]NIN51357.1 MFS transporter [Gemmatimonadales bacterium]NIP08821.1 MFS transporter [Gemmatimonadales bacterium]NIQ99815.1 MFS transporter [Gemmatimonadales bacterium]